MGILKSLLGPIVETGQKGLNRVGNIANEVVDFTDDIESGVMQTVDNLAPAAKETVEKATGLATGAVNIVKETGETLWEEGKKLMPEMKKDETPSTAEQKQMTQSHPQQDRPVQVNTQ